ncbi:Aldehyde dehydrogenase [Pyrenophora tritici-repentis]|nr:Aldehyde dehydrogenase [Pyrenophora tritici-repentis]KAI0605354.1 Aldehyde dehydrogenase [Pyrenophora tritici-repentis]
MATSAISTVLGKTSVKNSPSDFSTTCRELNETFASGRTKSIQWRKWQLKQQWWMIDENENEILAALTSDLGRHEMECRSPDILGLKTDILEHIEKIEEWAVTKPIHDAGLLFGRLGKARLLMEPLGVVLIIGVWNFPFLLTIQPSTIRVVTGGPQETSKLLENKFNHIFFTGSAKIARFITAAAAKHLTPTTLELGGQCPAIVTKSANIELAAKRIAAVKFLNAGQICLAVNHVFVDPRVHDEFLSKLEHYMRQSADTGHMCRIINRRNYGRLQDMVNKSEGKVIHCGLGPKGKNSMGPIIVANVSLIDSVMSDELFGPICPVLKDAVSEAITAINSLPRPLALYIFSSDNAETERIQSGTISGGVTLNDATMHAGVPNAPFGGVGDSGMGYYHGKYGFLGFTHQRTVVEPPTWLDYVMGFRYPPYDMGNLSKLAVPNRLGFRKGETMEDQILGSSRSVRVPWRSLMLVGVLGSFVYWIDSH